MSRLVVVLIAALVCAPAAQARVRVTVTTAAGTAAPGMVGGYEQDLTDPSRLLAADGCLAFRLCPAPELRADPGATVIISVDGPVDELTADAGDVSATPRDATTLTVTPASLPVDLRIGVRETTATHRLSYGYLLRLVAPPPPPVVTPTPTVAPALPPVPSVARGARLNGRRLTFTVVCPAAAQAACGGTVTVRAKGRTLASKPFAGVAPGARRTLKTTLRRRSTKLLAVLAVPGAAPVTTRLSIR